MYSSGEPRHRRVILGPPILETQCATARRPEPLVPTHVDVPPDGHTHLSMTGLGVPHTSESPEPRQVTTSGPLRGV